MQTYTCSYCKTDYQTKWKPKGRGYCSKSCANKANPRRTPEGKCLCCGVPITTRRKYCSKACELKNPKEHNRQTAEERSTVNKAAVVRYRQNTKLKAIEYLGGKCIYCGYNKCAASLAFHHRDPTEKSFGLSHRGLSRKFEDITTELDKCDLVCSNCHGELHAGLIGSPTRT